MRDCGGRASRSVSCGPGAAVGFHKADTKTVHHPEVGTILLDCDTLAVPGGGPADHDLLGQAPGTAAARQLALLATLGLQTTATALG